jgi:hypothetical protein
MYTTEHQGGSHPRRGLTATARRCRLVPHVGTDQQGLTRVLAVTRRSGPRAGTMGGMAVAIRSQRLKSRARTRAHARAREHGTRTGSGPALQADLSRIG